MKLNLNELENRKQWEAVGVALPQYDIAAMRQNTKSAPEWVHFGAGNIFRGFPAVLQQRLLNERLAQKGIIAIETFDYDIIDITYTPFDNLTMNVTLKADATADFEIIASIAQAFKAGAEQAQTSEVYKIFENPSLQMASFTITEKGYAIKGTDGNYIPVVRNDIESPPYSARHIMSVVTSALNERFKAGGYPVAMVSMDNCSKNGDVLKSSILTIAKAWQKIGFVDSAFLEYLEDGIKVSFPWSMIDKITPRPDKKIEQILKGKCIDGMESVITGKSTYIAPFVNAEKAEYLIVEDDFPNGRPLLEKAGVYLTDRDTVNKAERMKVTTCLNPLHTAMSVYGCLLGYSFIHEEMKDSDIVALIKRLGYIEGLPVVTDPGIISPREFIDEVVHERLPNPFMPDKPQRIATDTSQKVGIRFGETIKSYIEQGLDLNELTSVALAIAGWLRYLLGIDDNGNPMEISPDPLKEELQASLSGIIWNDPASYDNQIKDILSNTSIFKMDISKTVLADKIEEFFIKELEGTGAVRRALKVLSV